MKDKELEELVVKFYKGETSLQEEQVLYKYLSNRDETGDFEAELTLFQLFERNRNDTPSQNLNQKTDELLIKLTRSPGLKKLTRLSLIGVAASVLLLLSFYLSTEWGWFTHKREVSTLSGETRKVGLPDGSRVWLNKNSVLNYPGSFSAKSRVVYLTGEAFFEVDAHLDWPFIVETSHTRTQVLGTAFSVKNYPGDTLTEVAISSGEVLFSVKKDRQLPGLKLMKNERGTYSKKSGRLLRKEIRSENHFAWKSGKLSFKNKPLGDVISDLERYFDVNLSIDDEALLNCHFYGTFNEPKMVQILTVLSLTMDIQFEKTADGYLLVGPGCAQVDTTDE